MESSDQSKLFSEFPPVTTQEWEAKILADLKGMDYAKKLIWKTEDGFDVRPYYRAEDLQGLEYLDVLPGEFPFVRGVRKEGNEWLIRQDFLTTDIEEANRLATDAISKGVNSVGLVATEVTTHMQMNRLLANVDLSNFPINFISSRSYPLTLELLIYEVSHRGADGEKIRGSINFDPISYLLLHGDFYVSWRENLEETEYLLNVIEKRLPHLKAININGHYFQEAGSSLVQEVAFTLASACEYLAGLTEKGFSIDTVSPRFMLSLGIGSNYFMEIAKLRAARMLWAKMVEAFHPGDQESMKIFIHSSTALWNKTLYDPTMNLLRTATEGMSAAIGNTDSVTVQPFDVSFRDPDDFSHRIARNQQLILKEESYLNRIIDPSAGAYYIENLTHSIAFHAWNLFRAVEEKGGMIECIKSGFIQEEIARCRQEKEINMAHRKQILIGTNQYPNLQENMIDKVGLKEEAEGETRSTYKKLPHYRAAFAFEQIRLATERYVKAGNKRPAVFLFTMGNLAMLRARASFTTNFFGCAGFDILDNPGFQSVDEGVEATMDSSADLVVICSSDDEYSQIVPEICRKIKAMDQGKTILVAGYPKEILESLKDAGVDDFIHLRSNLFESLKKFQSILGIK